MGGGSSPRRSADQLGELSGIAAPVTLLAVVVGVIPGTATSRAVGAEAVPDGPAADGDAAAARAGCRRELTA